ncbi:helix-turn-helix domain-containing protein [Streptomyces sp. NBC_00859]|uniref:helix-turn-helix domain-containing protein n=1 Tax=Streptomyces sp. NBC_00859 TaxID=2903682 RepID=UPI0038636A85
MSPHQDYRSHPRAVRRTARHHPIKFSTTLHAHPTHLIRCFKQTYGLPPHAYLTGKRVEHARRLLLDGHRPAEVATTVGLHDQAHLNRHFTRHVGTTPARYQRTRTGSYTTIS